MQFFVMEQAIGVPGETWCSYLKPEHEGDAPTCPLCSRVIGSLRTLPPYGVELKVHGKTLGDVAFCSGDALVVSTRFRIAWENAQLRGLEFDQVERVRVRPARLGKKTPTYFHVIPQFSGTHVDTEQSLIEHEAPISCTQCHYGGLIGSIRGMRVDSTSWSGEDMFYAWGLCGTVIVTDRVRQLRDDHGLTNVTLTPTEEYFWDPLKSWTPIDYSPPDDFPGANMGNMDERYAIWDALATRAAQARGEK